MGGNLTLLMCVSSVKENRKKCVQVGECNDDCQEISLGHKIVKMIRSVVERGKKSLVLSEEKNNGHQAGFEAPL